MAVMQIYRSTCINRPSITASKHDRLHAEPSNHTHNGLTSNTILVDISISYTLTFLLGLQYTKGQTENPNSANLAHTHHFALPTSSNGQRQSLHQGSSTFLAPCPLHRPHKSTSSHTKSYSSLLNCEHVIGSCYSAMYIQD